MHRGEVWWAALPEPLGSGPGFRRPVVIGQIDQFNASRINTVIVVAVTSNLRLANAPGNVFLDGASCGLPKDSVLNVSQVLTIDKSSLTEQIGRLPNHTIDAMDTGLRLVLGL